MEKNEAYFQDIYRNAVELSAMLCRQYRLDPMEPGVILDHAGGHALGIASNHSDVGQWWPLHGKTMDDFRRAVRDAMRGGEETVTQEQFDAMMADYLARRGREKPSDWSENARRWAEEAGLVSGDSAGMRYRDFTTREETIQFLYRYQQVTEGKP